TEVPAARMVIYQYLAQAEVMRGQFEVARSHARRALEVDGNDIPTLLMLYQVLIVLGDRSAGAVGERLVRRRVALLQMPLQPATLQAMFRGVMQRHYWLNDMAVASFQHALDIEQGCSWAALALAQMAQDAADYSRAIIWYRQLLKEDEFAPEAHSSIADCYMALGDYRNAIVHYNDALALVRHYPRARLGKERAETLRDARDARDARDTSQPQ
ncbi:MAG: tetratricopeptide repeat protein, partial [Planctomycetota bacterium]